MLIVVQKRQDIEFVCHFIDLIDQKVNEGYDRAIGDKNGKQSRLSKQVIRICSDDPDCLCRKKCRDQVPNAGDEAT